MKSHSYILTFVLTGLLLVSSYAVAAKDDSEGDRHIVWSHKINAKTGLYTNRNTFVAHGISMGVSALYYYGDVDNVGWGAITNGGFNPKNLGIGGGLYFNYYLPAGNHCNLRMGLMSGLLRADNTEKFKALDPPRTDYRWFNSIFVEPSFGVEYYPFSLGGFYLYGGVSITAGFIRYDFMGGQYHNHHDGQKRTYAFLPMVQLGLGYTWQIDSRWTLGVELMIQEGLTDRYYMNLDAYPLAPGQQYQMGQSNYGTNLNTANSLGEVNNGWNDGWFQLGIVVAYRWKTCERCRMANGIQQYRKKIR